MLILLACSQSFEEPSPGRPHQDTRDPSLESMPLVIDDTGSTDSTPESAPDSRPDSAPDSTPTDIDHDGWPENNDCNDHDPDTHPGAPEVWYDGLDQDCLGGDDWDQDQDGQQIAPKGPDCDDTRSDTYTGALEIWYDGIDQSCEGDSDFDQDKDGEELGVDCDDLDALVNSLAIETLGDTVDFDCNGDPDTAEPISLPQSNAQGLQGPRLISDSTGTWMLVIADRLTLGNQAKTTVGARYQLEASQPALGVIDTLDWSWGGAFSFDTGLGFWQDGRYMVASYGLHDQSNRYLVADVRDLTGNQWGTFSLATATPEPFADLELASDGQGELHVVGCDDGPGTLGWVAGTPSQWFQGQARAYDELSGVAASACAPRPQAATVLVGTTSLATYTTLSGGLAWASSQSLLAATNVYDIAVRGENQELVGVALGSSGAWLLLDGIEESLPGTDVTRLDIASDATGSTYAIVMVDAGAARLVYGNSGAWTSVVLPTSMATVDEVAVTITHDNYLVWSARSGVDLVVSSLFIP